MGIAEDSAVKKNCNSSFTQGLFNFSGHVRCTIITG